MVLDHESCSVEGCVLHPGLPKPPQSLARRNEDIREDWKSGKWFVEELASFWGVRTQLIESIVAGRVDKAQPVR